eukprot:EST49306.1 ADP-ribosylglycohydrolase [Spironucleus salmonicida]
MTVDHIPHISLFLLCLANSSVINIDDSPYKDSLEAYLLNLKNKNLNLDKISRTFATILAGAVGDAFGYTIEFMQEDSIKQKFGILQEFQDTASDDTQMTLFTILGIKNMDIHEAYKDWYRTQQQQKNFFTGKSQAIQVRRAPGNTCLQSLSSRVHIKNSSKGCGTIMRVAPFGLFSETRDQAFQSAYKASEITHGHIDGLLPAGIFAAMIFDAVHKIPITYSNYDQFVPQQYLDQYDKSQTKRILQKLQTINPEQPKISIESYFKSNFLQQLHQLGEGWVAEETLAISLLSIQAANSFKNLCILSSNHKGDSDSTASVAGNLYGALNGLKSIDIQSLVKLDLFEEIIFTIWYYYLN